MIFLILFTSFFITLVVLPRLSDMAPKIGLMDLPHKRKIHMKPKPLVGGLGIFTAFLVCSLLLTSFSNLQGFYAGLLLLIIIGFFDDLKGLAPRWKFLVQILAAILLIFFNKTVLISVGNILFLGPIHLGIFAIPVTIFCIVGVINAINMIDGIDGLAGGISFISLVSFAVLSYLNQQKELMIISTVLSGAVIGFLRYNWYPSKLFMGDIGSNSLGFTMAFLSIALSQKGKYSVSPMVPVLILAVPIVDTLTVMIKRKLRNESPFRAGKDHIHHVLLRMGFDKKTTVTVILSVSFLFSLLGIFGTFLKIPDYYLFLIFCTYFIFYFSSSFYVKEIYTYRMKLTRRIRIAKCNK
ncbi:MAG: undecaprenyl/decaprenyl-phosphate alpha-N-acetylglucosaminyl 1-phosphate transferase [wastewater metagenome]|nr:undecaprenyl/decaprenyl-phosphate alpha-N-acetylglucosaminyl 1-phosphate transferase [Candidatus Loosdrechtia aerotolerans]